MQLSILSAGAGLLLALLFASTGRPELPSHATREQRTSCPGVDSLDAVVGRYRQGPASVLFIERRADRLVARPIFWSAVQPLRFAGPDSLVVTDRPERTLALVRDAVGCVRGVVATRLDVDGPASRLSGEERTPVELLFAHKPEQALRAFRAEAALPDEQLVKLAARLLGRFPSRAAVAGAFLRQLTAGGSTSAEAFAALGMADVAVGDRRGAEAAFSHAARLDAANADAAMGRRRLRQRAALAPEGWTLPYSLEELLRPPTREERSLALEDWTRRRRAAVDARVESQTRVPIGADSATLLVVTHGPAGARRVGAIVIPDRRTASCCGVLLDIKGVAPNYPPLAVPGGMLSPAMLGELSRQVILVTPALPGEILTVGAARWESAGDRTDSFDGAAEDALQLLEVALGLVPQADSTRVCAFGHSRGGSVALLAGERSARLKCVVAMAAPTDWFALMPGGSPGWTTSEVVGDGLRQRATPDQDGGQFIERFVRRSIAGVESLTDARLRLLRSSPLYFADRLPDTQVHYGIEDPSVPVQNGSALRAAWRSHRNSSARREAHFYPNAGHDTDRPVAFMRAREFLRRELRLVP